MDHIVTGFDADLAVIGEGISRMGALAVGEATDALDALTRRDADLAAQVVERDHKLDELELEIEDRCVRLMALRQPVAGDLRRVVAVMKTAGNLERCGDLAKNIAKRAILVSGSDLSPSLVTPIRRLGDLVLRRLEETLAAYADRDLVKAGSVWSRDREVDEIYEALFRELLTHMMADPRVIAACTQLLFVAKNLERIGDHATNIAELVHYELTGEQLTERPKA